LLPVCTDVLNWRSPNSPWNEREGFNSCQTVFYRPLHAIMPPIPSSKLYRHFIAAFVKDVAMANINLNNLVDWTGNENVTATTEHKPLTPAGCYSLGNLDSLSERRCMIKRVSQAAARAKRR
jgi:hypothetical protein